MDRWEGEMHRGFCLVLLPIDPGAPSFTPHPTSLDIASDFKRFYKEFILTRNTEFKENFNSHDELTLNDLNLVYRLQL